MKVRIPKREYTKPLLHEGSGSERHLSNTPVPFDKANSSNSEQVVASNSPLFNGRSPRTFSHSRNSLDKSWSSQDDFTMRHQSKAVILSLSSVPNFEPKVHEDEIFMKNLLRSKNVAFEVCYIDREGDEHHGLTAQMAPGIAMTAGGAEIKLPQLRVNDYFVGDLEALHELEREHLLDSLLVPNEVGSSVSRKSSSPVATSDVNTEAKGRLLDLASITRSSSQGDVMKMLVQLEAEVRTAQIELQLSGQIHDDSINKNDMEGLDFYLDSPKSGLPQQVRKRFADQIQAQILSNIKVMPSDAVSEAPPSSDMFALHAEFVDNAALQEENRQLKLELSKALSRAESAERELSDQASHAADAITTAVTSRREEIVRLKREMNRFKIENQNLAHETKSLKIALDKALASERNLKKDFEDGDKQLVALMNMVAHDSIRLVQTESD